MDKPYYIFSIIEGVGFIEIIVHFPTTEQGQKQLQQKVAQVHAEAIKNYLQRFSCPQKQKLELLDAIKGR